MKALNNHNTIKLRPHHLLCTQGYNGKGYSDDFVKNMTAITAELRGDAYVVVDIVFCTDDICNKCPKMLGEDLCETNEKVKLIDQKITEYFGIEAKKYVYKDIIQKINTKMTEAMMDDICGNCEWYPVSACREKCLRL